MNYKIIEGDVVEQLQKMDDNSFHAVLCDPPYAISFMNKDFDKFDTPLHFQKWCQEWGTELLRVLKPGGYALCFGGTRTYHRLTTGLEDAGFEIRDSISWIYGSGFPKSLNIGLKLPEFKGYGTGTKPAHEPCVLAQKPRLGTYADNCFEHGCGGLNIDGTRIGTEEIQSNSTVSSGGNMRGISLKEKTKWNGEHSTSTGRFPSNVIFSTDCPVCELNHQSNGTKRSPSEEDRERTKEQRVNPNNTSPLVTYNDKGGASRFFYVAKCSTAERNAGCDNTHPTVKPITLITYLAKLICPPKDGKVLVPFAGSGSEMIGCLRAGFEEVVGIELDPEYINIAEKRLKFWADDLDAPVKEVLKKAKSR